MVILMFKSGTKMSVKILLRAESIMIAKDSDGLFYIINRNNLVKEPDDQQ